MDARPDGQVDVVFLHGHIPLQGRDLKVPGVDVHQRAALEHRQEGRPQETAEVQK
jgi:hypothetical protein